MAARPSLYELVDSEEAFAEAASWADDMRQIRPPTHSRDEVRQAGKAVASEVVWSEDRHEEIIGIFSVVNNWRDAHLVPMRSLKLSLDKRIHHLGLDGLTASRAKRMASIRKKLARTGIKLDRVQDLAGCRAILPDMASVNALVENCMTRMPHDLRKHDDYVHEKPKANGYRSHHIIWNYRGKGERSAFDGLSAEVQIRTRLQHSWATAVEAVGLLRDEDMKAGEGNADWLRLFALMSGEFADVEGCPVHPSLPDHSERLREIRSLNDALSAAETLEQIKVATQHLGSQVIGATYSQYFMLVYDRSTQTVSVEPFTGSVASASALHDAEMQISKARDGRKVVLIQIGQMEKLADAYPNYFGDVTFFVRNLRAICEGRGALEYTLAEQEPVKRMLEEPADIRWFRQRFGRKRRS